MSAIALQALADETGGQLVGDSVALQTLVIDSREVKGGDLFAALSGQRVDGHDFAPHALAAGASALLTERVLEGLSPQLVVADVLEASGCFGALKRQAHTIDFLIGFMPFARNQHDVTHLGLGNHQRDRGSPV